MDSYGLPSCACCFLPSSSSTSTAPGRRIVKWMLRLLFIAILPLVSLPLLVLLMASPPNTSPPPHPPPPTIEQVRQLGSLVTTRGQVAAVRETSLEGYLGSVTAVLQVQGEILIGPDLTLARIEAIDHDTRTVHLTLPRPRRISARLDHEQTTLLSLSHEGLWIIAPGDSGRSTVLQRAYADAQRYLDAIPPQPKIVNQSCQHTQDVLAALFATAGWQVELAWQ